MFADYAPIQSLPLTLVMPMMIVQGSFRARLRRLTDVMNEPDNTSMVLTDVTFFDVASGRESGTAPIVKIQTSEVLMVHTTVPTEGSGHLRTMKRPIGARIFMPPFTIEGTVHLVVENELRMAIQSLIDRWVPVTDAAYWSPASADYPRAVDLVVVNHARAHIAVLSEDGWDQAAEFVMPDRSSNPW